ncbi:MAG: TetR/AcrR family transcriptional regulator [bacterium]
MSNTQFPLREKRKAATRTNLIRAAQALFAQQGYDETTLEAVADHAGLHVQTLYRHFASKQELATAGDQEMLERFRQAISDPGRTDHTFDFWREWVRTAVARLSQEDGARQYRDFLIQRWTSALVSSQLIRIGQEYEDLLAESFVKDFGGSSDNLEIARLAAITLWGANSRVQRLHASQNNYNFAQQAVAAVDTVEALFKDLLKPR